MSSYYQHGIKIEITISKSNRQSLLALIGSIVQKNLLAEVAEDEKLKALE